MKNQILVMNSENERIGMTYERRAMQLVGKGRAKWLDKGKTAICLFDEEKEIVDMDTYEAYGNGERYDDAKKPERERSRSAVMPDEVHDDILYKIAKQKVNDRFAIIMHWATYSSVFVVSLVVVSSFWWRLTDFLMVILGLWAVGLFLHTVFYFVQVTPHKIQKEYQKLNRKR